MDKANKFLNKAINEAMDETNEFLDKRKTEIIVKTAEKLLEAGVQKDTICMEIIKGLKDKVDPSTVRKVLNPEYKDQKHRDSILNRYSS